MGTRPIFSSNSYPVLLAWESQSYNLRSLGLRWLHMLIMQPAHEPVREISWGSCSYLLICLIYVLPGGGLKMRLLTFLLLQGDDKILFFTGSNSIKDKGNNNP